MNIFPCKNIVIINNLDFVNLNKIYNYKVIFKELFDKYKRKGFFYYN